MGGIQVNVLCVEKPYPVPNKNNITITIKVTFFKSLEIINIGNLENPQLPPCNWGFF